MLPDFEMVTRLVTAALLGSVVGFERERLLWTAGLRTHMLVCVGAALIMIVSAFGFADILSQPHVTLDPSRIAAQVVSGIGFLGAGTILLRGEVVKGLTTAASLWSVAAIGLAVGSGLYLAAGCTTVIILLILAGVKPLERRLHARLATRSLRVVAARGAITLHRVQETAGEGILIRQFVLQRQTGDEADEVSLSFERLSNHGVEAIADKLRALDGVKSVAVTD